MREMSEDENRRLAELIMTGQKIQAIKLYNEATGAGLIESKDHVDNLENQLRAENPENLPVSMPPGSITVPAMQEEDARQMTNLIFSGEKIQAIKMYREASRQGLKESKDFIDALEKQLRVECPDRFAHPARSGCGAVVLIGGLLAIAAGAAALG